MSTVLHGINYVVSKPIPIANICMVINRAVCFPQSCSTSLHQWRITEEVKKLGSLGQLLVEKWK